VLHDVCNCLRCWHFDKLLPLLLLLLPPLQALWLQ
jgi:hypothetical protein